MTRRYLIFALILILIVPALFAQQANITTPDQTNVETKVIASLVDLSRDCVCAFVEVVYQNASGTDLRRQRFQIPADPNNPGTELNAFAGAIINARSGETGSNTRRLNFRALGYLSDAGRLPGVTLVP
jgi:hypothetical protein